MLRPKYGNAIIRICISRCPWLNLSVRLLSQTQHGGPFSTPWQLFSLPVCCVVGNVLQSVLHPLLWCSASHLSPSNRHSWFFHFHLSPLLPYPLFPSHSVFLASCFPFLSSLMCLSSPLLPPHCFFFLFFPPAHYRTSPVLCCLMCCWILPHPSSRIFCFSSVSLPSPLLLPFLSRLSDYLVSTAL